MGHGWEIASRDGRTPLRHTVWVKNEVTRSADCRHTFPKRGPTYRAIASSIPDISMYSSVAFGGVV